MDIVLLIILAGVAGGSVSIVFYTFENGISPSPTSGKVKLDLLDIVSAL